MKTLFKICQGLPTPCIFVTLLALAPLTSQAQFRYTTNNGALTIYSYVGPGGNLIIPASIDGLPVTGIEIGTFEDESTLASVSIPDSVTWIGGAAFAGCVNLTNINIPPAVSRIDLGTFYDCQNLATLTIPAAVTNIAMQAFAHCSSLAWVSFQGNAPAVTSDAFLYADSAIVYYVPGTTGWSATFAGRPTVPVLSYSISNGQVAITNYDGPGGPLTIPATIEDLPVTAIGAEAFKASGLTSVLVADSVTNLGLAAFSECYSLATVVLPSQLQSLPEAAFMYCASLTNLSIPAAVTNIGTWAFRDCTNLASVSFHTNAPTLGVDPFLHDDGATVYYLSGTAGWAATFGGRPTVGLDFSYHVDNGQLCIDGYVGLSGDLTIPATMAGLPVTTIGSSAFAGSAVTNVTLPDSVQTIGDLAFFECYDLQSVRLGTNLSRIEDAAFGSCQSLASITFPDALTYIGPNAFTDTALTDLAIPRGVTTIADGAFSGCTALTNASIGRNVTSIGVVVFVSCNRLAAISVDPLNPAYSSVDGVLLNKSQTAIIEFPAGKTGTYIAPASVTSIREHAFTQRVGLTELRLASVTNIGDYAFSLCSNLTGVFFRGDAPSYGTGIFASADKVTVYYLRTTTGWGPTFAGRPTAPWPIPFDYSISNGEVTILGYLGAGGEVIIPATIESLPVTAIGAGSFYLKTNVTRVTIPEGVRSIGDEAFVACHNLAAVTLPDNLTSIGESAFAGCSGLTSVRVPNGITQIPNRAFFACIGLTNVTLGTNVTSIGYQGFGACWVLASINLPDTLTDIGEGAFVDSGLTAVTIPASVTNIGGGAFYSSAFTLATITVDPLNPAYCSLDGVLYDKSVTRLIQYPTIKTGPYIAPASVASIGQSAFAFCSELSDVYLGNVINIESEAFGWSYVTRVFFRGDAPTVSSRVFWDTLATVYYLPGTSGWGATLADRPTAPWHLPQPIILTLAPYFGVQTNRFGFRVSWATNASVVVEVSSNLAGSSWIPLSTNDLTGVGWSYFSDPDRTNYPARFYRIRFP